MPDPHNYVNVSRRPPDVEDYIDILRRYRSWVIGPTFAGLVLSVVVACWLPDVYICNASLQIKPPAVSRELLPTASNTTMSQRLQNLKLEILARDNLVQLITDPQLDLYKTERARLPVGDVADEYLRKKINVQEFALPGENHGAGAFRISFEYPDRVKAQKVVTKLIDQFTNKTLIDQQSTASSQDNLLEDLLKNARTKMEESQTEMARFMSENQGKLPQNFESNALDVTTRSQQLMSINDAISQDKQREAILEMELQNNRNALASLKTTITTSRQVGNPTVRNTNLINLQSKINDKSDMCKGLETRYQPNFPDVQTCKEQLRAMEVQYADIEKQEGATAGGGTRNELVETPDAEAVSRRDDLVRQGQNFEAQLRQYGMDIQSKQANAVQIEKLLKEAQERVSGSPTITQEYNAILQRLNLATDEFQKATLRKEASNASKSMEDHRAGETLDILEAAVTPDTPAAPNRPAMIAIGTIGGLVLGFALAGAKEIKNTSLKNLKDVRAYTNLPVLSSIPLLENALLVRRKRRLAWLAWSSAVIIGGFLMCSALYYHVVISPTKVG